MVAGRFEDVFVEGDLVERGRNLCEFIGVKVRISGGVSAPCCDNREGAESWGASAKIIEDYQESVGWTAISIFPFWHSNPQRQILKLWHCG